MKMNQSSSICKNKSSTLISIAAKTLLLLLSLAVVSNSSIISTIAVNEVASQSSSNTVTSQNSGQNYAENDRFTLSIDKATTSVSVLDKQTGKSWRTNPSTDQMNQLKNPSAKIILSAQLELKYYDISNKEYTIDNYTESILKNQFTIVAIKNGLRVVYDIGRKEARMLVPDVMEIKTFNALISKLSTSDQQDVKSYYSILKYTDLSGSYQSDMVKKYPSLKNEKLYVVRDLGERIRLRLDGHFKDAGLTVAAMDQNYQKIGYQPPNETYPYFQIPIEYTIDANGLNVRVPVSQIKYDAKNYFLNTLSVIRYFGCTPENSNGYIFVPDGSGAIISLNKDTTSTFFKNMYGSDYSFSDLRFDNYSPNMVLPVFGMKDGSNAFFTIIEQGESKAQINAATSKSILNENFVGATFTLLDMEGLLTGANKRNSIVKFSENLMQSDIKMAITFLKDNDANYSGMARYYKNTVFKNQKPQTLGNTPFYLESIGAIEKQKHILGFPVTVTEPLTTFSQGEKVIEKLGSVGIKNIQYKFDGWLNGGMESTAPNRANVVGILGGKNGFKSLLDYANKNDTKLYPDVDFSYVAKDNFFDGFSAIGDSSRSLYGKVVTQYDFNVGTLTNMDSLEKYILSPNKIFDFSKKFLKSYSQLGNKNLSVGTLGSDLNSDFRKGKQISRPQAEQRITQTLSGFNNIGYSLMVDGGNAYSLPYVKNIVNIPDDYSGFDIEDCSVPFLQIVLHGYVSYSGSAMNLSEDTNKDFLQAVETGESLHFLLNYADGSEVKGTNYSYLYSTNYKVWVDLASKQYADLNAVLKQVNGSPIYDHSKVSDGVYVTNYENGIYVCVNYSDKATIYKGNTVAPQNFISGSTVMNNKAQ